jgi:uridine phosphorylase
LRRFFDQSPLVLRPSEAVLTFTGSRPEELLLPERAVIVFHEGDIKRIAASVQAVKIDAWSRFKTIYRLGAGHTVITRSFIGGPNIAALVEELSAFGVKEFVMWGYCGGIATGLDIGNIIVAKGALREDGTSYHYLKEADAHVYSNWLEYWKEGARDHNFSEGMIWSCDAIYRETVGKVERYREMGLSAVEMEVASFYAVCRYREVKGVAFLVVSDLLRDGKWIEGFSKRRFKNGVNALSAFIIQKVVTGGVASGPAVG